MGIFPDLNPNSKILVINGVELVQTYEQMMLDYQKRLKGSGFLLKEIRSNGKTYRYWYSWRYNAAKQNNDWKYCGKNQPVQVQDIPPQNPLAGVQFETVGHDLLFSKDDYAKIKHLFGDKYRVFLVSE